MCTYFSTCLNVKLSKPFQWNKAIACYFYLYLVGLTIYIKSRFEEIFRIPINTFFSALYGKLLFANQASIMEFDVNTNNTTLLVEHGDTCILDLDYDYQSRYVYFLRFYGDDIVRYVIFYYNNS